MYVYIYIYIYKQRRSPFFLLASKAIETARGNVQSVANGVSPNGASREPRV